MSPKQKETCVFDYQYQQQSDDVSSCLMRVPPGEAFVSLSPQPSGRSHLLEVHAIHHVVGAGVSLRRKTFGLQLRVDRPNVNFDLT